MTNQIQRQGRTFMEHIRIFSATLGISPPWQVTEVLFSAEGMNLNISVEYLHDQHFLCPTCQTILTCEHSAEEVWCHASFFRRTAYLHARVPHFICPACGVIAIERPWSRQGSKFTLLADGPATS
jgi:predicted RNA-binding Zn-ribbon protein involved in translation (DUF1610 family)